MKHKKEHLIHYITYTLREIYHVKPLQFVCLYTFFLLNGILSGLTLPCTQLLFDRIEMVANGTEGYLYAFNAALLLMFIRIAEQAFNFFATFLGENYDMFSYKVLKDKLNHKAATLSALDYENPNVINDLNKAENGIRGFVQFVNVFMDTLVNYLPYFFITTLYLKTIHPVLILILVIIFISIIAEQVVSSKIYTEIENDLSPILLKINYFESCIKDRTVAMEARSLIAQPFFLKKIRHGLDTYNKIKQQGNKNLALVSLLSNLIVILEYASILLLMFYLMLHDDLSVTSFAAIFISIDTLFQAMQVLIHGRFGRCVKFYAGMKNYIHFMECQFEEIGTLEQTMQSKIILEHVSFSYPSTEKNALDDISFDITKGEIIAIVGENGSGKSTLAKLLTGLYPPTSGKIYFSNKVGLPTEQVSALFQNFSRYPFSLKENICLGDTEKVFEEKTYLDIINKAGLGEVVALPTKVPEQVLSVDFGGTDLSGGQWQKVALARALYKNSPFFVMDEPTAALDPISEIEFYKQMKDITAGKTVLIITHRLGSIKFADRVLVMKNGKILGFDKHEALLSNCKYYKEFWESGTYV